MAIDHDAMLRVALEEARLGLEEGGIPIGSALGGVLGETLGSRAGVGIATVVFATSALPMLSRRVRSIRQATDARPAEVAA